jgi:predicted RNA-binding protein with PUA-like domain
MAKWLLKTEPSTYGYDDLERERRAVWDGVTNPVALKHLRAIRKGDELLVYHTGDEKAVVGLARAVSDPYPDPKRKDPKLAVVDLAPVRRLPRPVTLAAVKQQKAFAAWELARLPRLSVMPVPEPIWRRLLEMGGE